MRATTTFSDLKKKIHRTAANDGVSTFDDDKIKDAIADGIQNYLDIRDWSWHRREYRLVTADPYEGAPGGTDSDGNASEIAATDDSATITGTNTEFQDTSTLDELGVLERDRIEVASERIWYEIAADAASETSLTLKDVYRGTGGTGLDFIIVRPAYNLPDDFREVKMLKGLGDIQDPRFTSFEDMIDRHAEFAGASQPYLWTTRGTEDDDNDGREQIMFYPAPNAVYQYSLSYIRRTGFLDISSSNAFLDPQRDRDTLADGDIITWPDNELAVLRAAIILAAYEEFEADESKISLAEMRYERAFKKAKDRDVKNGELQIWGGGMNPRPDWY